MKFKRTKKLLVGMMAVLLAIQTVPVYCVQAAAKFKVTAEGCEGAGEYEEGTEVTVTAPYDEAGKRAFVEWKIEGLDLKEGTASGSIEGFSKKQNPLKFTMPAKPVKLTPVYKEQVQASKVAQTDSGKYYLEVDGKPWFYHFIQNMGMWERLGNHAEFKEGSWSAYDDTYPQEHLPLGFTENMYEKSDNLNFNTVSQVLWWREIEVEPGVYDFTSMDKYIEWAEKYGMKIDLAWFGSVCGMGSRIPDHSIASEGSDHQEVGYQHTAPAWFANSTYYNVGANSKSEQFSLNIKDSNKENADYMKQRECYAIQALFNYLAERDANHTVISVQIENEPNGTGGQFGQYIEWMNDVAKAVKESAYVVPTRVNYIGKGYPLNINDYEYLDFAGPDVYSRSVEQVQSSITSGKEKSTLLYIPENSGGYDNLTTVATATFTAGGFYGTWSLNNWYCVNKLHGIYQGEKYESEMYYDWELGKMPTLTSQGVDLKHYNVGLNNIGSLITLAAPEEMTGLNIDTDVPEETYDSYSKLGTAGADGIGAYDLGLKTTDGAVGIGVLKGQNIYVTTDTATEVTIKTKQKPIKVTTGHADLDGNWIEEAEKEVTEENGEYCVVLETEKSIQLQMPEGKAVPELGESDNLAVTATASTNPENSGAKNLNDNDAASSMKMPAANVPFDIIYTWEEPQAVDQIEIATKWAQSQAPTEWKIEVSENGTDNWKEVAATTGKVEWSTNLDAFESQFIQIPRQKGIKGLKIHVLSSNTVWNECKIHEIRVFDTNAGFAAYVESVKDAGLKEEDYPEELWKKFSEALAEADGLLEKGSATQEEVDACYEKLYKAKRDMESKEKADLANAMKRAQAEADKTDVYTPETLQKLNDILETAQQIFSNPDSTKAEIVDITAKVNEAVNGLVVKAIERIEVTAPAKTVYEQGEELDLAGLKVTAVYNDGSTEDVTDSAAVAKEGYDPNKVGEQTITVTYGDKTGEFTVTVKEKTTPIDPEQPDTGDVEVTPNPDNAMGTTLPNVQEVKDAVVLDDEEQQAVAEGKKIKVTLEVQEKTKEEIAQTAPADVQAVENTLAGDVLNKQYVEGAYLDLSLFKTIEDDENTKKAITETAKEVTIEITLPENLVNADPTINRTYKIIRIHNGESSILDTILEGIKLTFKTDRFSTYALVYNDAPVEQPTPDTPTLTDLQVTPPVKTEYTVGEELDTTGLAVTAVYSDGTSSDVTGEAVLTGYNKDQAGEQTITVSYKEVSKTFQVVVKESGDKPNPDDKPGTDDKPNPDDKPGTADKPGTDNNQNSGNGSGQNNANTNNQNSGSGSSQTSGTKTASSSPQTGDAQNIMLFVCMMILAGGAATVILAKRRRVR